MTRRRIAAAEETVEDLVERPNATPPKAGSGGNPVPYTVDPKMRRFEAIVRTVTDEAERTDVDREFTLLEARLKIEGALTPEKLRHEQNDVDMLAYRAHKLYVVARVALERFSAEAEIALGAMREAATASLQAEKDSGKLSKQITDTSVADRARAMYPDEFREIELRKVMARKVVDNLEFLADRWARRSATLASMAG